MLGMQRSSMLYNECKNKTNNKLTVTSMYGLKDESDSTPSF